MGELIAESGATADAFHELFDRHFNAVHRYLGRRVRRDREGLRGKVLGASARKPGDGDLRFDGGPSPV
jgi:hypothetical protein